MPLLRAITMLWLACTTATVAVAGSAQPPRERLSINAGWRFHQGDPEVLSTSGRISFVQSDFDDSVWQRVDLPHDGAVRLRADAEALASTSVKLRTQI